MRGAQEARMANPWEQDQTDEAWSDREAWRGDAHLDDVDHWRDASSGTWETPSEVEPPVEPEPEVDWPEGLAGPEYWLFKRELGD